MRVTGAAWSPDATRRPPFLTSDEMSPVSVEIAQLRHVATHDPEMTTRLVAITFLNLLLAVNNGVYGGVAVESLFD